MRAPGAGGGLLDRGILALTDRSGPVRRVLVLRALGLGDFLTGVPAYRALRRTAPAATITLAAPAVLRPLLGPGVGVDELWPTTGLGRLGWTGPPPDLAVNLHGAGPQSTADLLGTAPRRLVSHGDPGRDVAGPPWPAEVHETVRWCRLLTAAGITADPGDLRLAPPRRDPVVAGAVVVHPGAAAPARRWPADRFAAVARALAGAGERVVLTGGPAEVPLTREVARVAGLPPECDLAGRLDLLDLAALVATARLVVCGDTGVAHLASAYVTPSVVLFGPTPPAGWGPPADGPHTVLWAGRTGNPHGAQPDPGLLELDSTTVAAAATERLAGSALGTVRP